MQLYYTLKNYLIVKLKDLKIIVRSDKGDIELDLQQFQDLLSIVDEEFEFEVDDNIDNFKKFNPFIDY